MSSDTPRDCPHGAQTDKCYVCECEELERENAELRQQLETERLRLAACGTAAIGYFTDCIPEYRSASLEDVLRLRQQLAERDALVEKWKETLERLARLGNAPNYGTSIGNCIAQEALALTPSTALAGHEAEVQRKVLEEAAAYLERDDFYNSSGMAAETVLRRMAKEG